NAGLWRRSTLIGAQQVWAHFRKSKFAKEFAGAVSLERTSVGKKEWRIGRRFRNFPNSLRIFPPPPPQRPRRHRKLRLRLQRWLQDRQLPLPWFRAADFHGTNATAKDFSPPSLKHCRWS